MTVTPPGAFSMWTLADYERYADELALDERRASVVKQLRQTIVAVRRADAHGAALAIESLEAGELCEYLRSELAAMARCRDLGVECLAYIVTRVEQERERDSNLLHQHYALERGQGAYR